jgi:homoserine O-succinyltransferase
MTDKRAGAQDIRPLKIAIVNLMPTKIATETQLLRLLGNTPLQVEISLIRMENHESKNINEEHLQKFYIGSNDLFKHHFDGMIITGAPVEQLPFEEVDYWTDLCEIMDWARTSVFSTLYICWGAQAGLYHLHGIPKKKLDKKLFGIFQNQRTTLADPLLRGFDDSFPIPQSRHTTVHYSDVIQHPELTILAQSDECGVTIVKSNDNREIFMTGHLEYDTRTLAEEYWRDKDSGLPIEVPKKLFSGETTQAFRRFRPGAVPPTCSIRTGSTIMSIRKHRSILPNSNFSAAAMNPRKFMLVIIQMNDAA